MVVSIFNGRYGDFKAFTRFEVPWQHIMLISMARIWSFIDKKWGHAWKATPNRRA
jgi:hypothetical protein